MKPQALVERGMGLFSGRKAITTLWQEIAENFYPQRADFTLTRHIGEEFAEHLYSSYPLMVHRDLSNSFAAMLRPRAKEWFEMGVEQDPEKLSHQSKAWLQWATKRMRAAMYDRRAQFIRATSEGDADFAAFGQCVISREINWWAETPHLLYRDWHLRDVAWSEQADGSIGEIYVKWKPTIKVLEQMKMDLHHEITKKKTQENLSTVECMRLCVSTDVYKGQQGEGEGWKYMDVYLDVQNMHVMKEFGTNSHGFTLPRWQTVSGSQYAYSPATVAGLPDARLLQSMSLTLLEAGEMSVRPPMLATSEAVRGDIQLYSGGITWTDSEYDNRKFDVLRPLNQDRKGLPTGFEQRDAQMMMLAEAFYINKLTLPPPQGDMTAFEVGQRVEEYVRAALPLFEPMEHEYNGQLCEDTFDGLLHAGSFGAPRDIPHDLQGRNIKFQFISPLHDAIERKEASVFMESSELIRIAMEMDPNSLSQLDIGSQLRSALEGIGVDHRHLRSEKQVKEINAQNAEMARMQEEAELAKMNAGTIAGVATAASKAA